MPPRYVVHGLTAFGPPIFLAVMMNLQEISSSTDLKNLDFTFLPSDYHAPAASRLLFFFNPFSFDFPPGLFSFMCGSERQQR
jgi:hypothetical protein